MQNMSVPKNPLDAVVFPCVKFPLKKHTLFLKLCLLNFMCDISMLTHKSLNFFRNFALFFHPITALFNMGQASVQECSDGQAAFIACIRNVLRQMFYEILRKW